MLERARLTLTYAGNPGENGDKPADAKDMVAESFYGEDYDDLKGYEQDRVRGWIEENGKKV